MRAGAGWGGAGKATGRNSHFLVVIDSVSENIDLYEKWSRQGQPQPLRLRPQVAWGGGRRQGIPAPLTTTLSTLSRGRARDRMWAVWLQSPPCQQGKCVGRGDLCHRPELCWGMQQSGPREGGLLRGAVRCTRAGAGWAVSGLLSDPWGPAGCGLGA